MRRRPLREPRGTEGKPQLLKGLIAAKTLRTHLRTRLRTRRLLCRPGPLTHPRGWDPALRLRAHWAEPGREHSRPR